jgi:hypothetical protein
MEKIKRFEVHTEILIETDKVTYRAQLHATKAADLTAHLQEVEDLAGKFMGGVTG